MRTGEPLFGASTKTSGTQYEVWRGRREQKRSAGNVPRCVGEGAFRHRLQLIRAIRSARSASAASAYPHPLRGYPPIRLGHPYGMTGSRMTGTLLLELRRQKKRWGIVTMCIGGGMGAAGLFEAIN